MSYIIVKELYSKPQQFWLFVIFLAMHTLSNLPLLYGRIDDYNIAVKNSRKARYKIHANRCAFKSPQYAKIIKNIHILLRRSTNKEISTNKVINMIAAGPGENRKEIGILGILLIL